MEPTLTIPLLVSRSATKKVSPASSTLSSSVSPKSQIWTLEYRYCSLPCLSKRQTVFFGFGSCCSSRVIAIAISSSAASSENFLINRPSQGTAHSRRPASSCGKAYPQLHISGKSAMSAPFSFAWRHALIPFSIFPSKLPAGRSCRNAIVSFVHILTSSKEILWCICW